MAAAQGAGDVRVGSVATDAHDGHARVVEVCLRVEDQRDVLEAEAEGPEGRNRIFVCGVIL